MKIYNKENFASGLLMLLLGVMNLVLGVRSEDNISVVTIALFIIGTVCLSRSFSKSFPPRIIWTRPTKGINTLCSNPEAGHFRSSGRAVWY